jgi:hypothetical protein
MLCSFSAPRITHFLVPPDHRRHSRRSPRHGQTDASARIARSRIGVVGAFRAAALARSRFRDARACGQARDGVESDVFGRRKWKGRRRWIERIRVASRSRHWFRHVGRSVGRSVWMRVYVSAHQNKISRIYSHSLSHRFESHTMCIFLRSIIRRLFSFFASQNM